MLAFRCSHLLVLRKCPSRLLSHSYGGSCGAPSSSSSLGPWQFPFHACVYRMGWFSHRGSDLGDAASGSLWCISWWSWNHLPMPTWVPFWVGDLKSGGRSTLRFLCIIRDFSLTSACFFSPFLLSLISLLTASTQTSPVGGGVWNNFVTLGYKLLRHWPNLGISDPAGHLPPPAAQLPAAGVPAVWKSMQPLSPCAVSGHLSTRHDRASPSSLFPGGLVRQPPPK